LHTESKNWDFLSTFEILAVFDVIKTKLRTTLPKILKRISNHGNGNSDCPLPQSIAKDIPVIKYGSLQPQKPCLNFKWFIYWNVLNLICMVGFHDFRKYGKIYGNR